MVGRDRVMGATLDHRRRGLVVAGIAVAGLAAALLVFVGSKGFSQPGPKKPVARFLPSDEQLRSFGVQTVALRPFRTEIITDGYVAASGGGGKGGSLPVLPAQASDMLQAENDLTSASAQYRNATAIEDRQHKLYQAEGASLKDWQQSQADLATAAVAVASAKNRLRLMGKSGDGKSGTFTVADNSSVWLIANVREADAGLVRAGDEVDAGVAALPDRTVSGQVGFVSSVIDPATHRLAIGARVANPGGVLRPNMLATLTIRGGDLRNAPAVPQNTIVYDGDKAHVWVVGPGRRLSLRNVKTGRTSGDFVEITAGLATGEHIATQGALFIDQAASND